MIDDWMVDYPRCLLLLLKVLMFFGRCRVETSTGEVRLDGPSTDPD
jgi:hypothetical protein